MGFDSWVWKSPWSRKRQLTTVFLPGEFHGQRSLAGYSARDWKSQIWLSNWTHTRTLPNSMLAFMAFSTSVPDKVVPAAGENSRDSWLLMLSIPGLSHSSPPLPPPRSHFLSISFIPQPRNSVSFGRPALGVLSYLACALSRTSIRKAIRLTSLYWNTNTTQLPAPNAGLTIAAIKFFIFSSGCTAYGS